MSSETKLANDINHIAIIMDGNGRWAKKNKVPKIIGHTKGRNALKKIVAKCSEIKLDVLTIFAFSSENISRSKNEVSHLFKLFLQSLKLETKSLKKNNIRLKLIGDLSVFPQEIQEQAQQSMDFLANCTGLTLVVAVNYGGQWDITQATQKIAKQIETGAITAAEVNQTTVKNNLCLSQEPPVDLLIRTSGEFRISNFLLWELAYSEFFFTNTLWPDFNVTELESIIANFSKRNRRYGGK